MPNYPLKSRTKLLGYSWKLCPFSLAYKTEYYDIGIPGPSNHVDLKNNPSWTELETTEHTLTSGSMSYKHIGTPGWICWDPNCYYYTTVSSGVYFFES